MSTSPSAGNPIGLPPGTRPAAGGAAAGGAGGYSLPAGIAGPGPVPAGTPVPPAGPVPPGPSLPGRSLVGGGEATRRPPWPGAPTPEDVSPLLSGAAEGADRVERREPPTWRDLPPEPPFGPVRPFLDRLPGRRRPVPELAEGEQSRITPAQIALTVGGVLLLLAIGVAAALLLLGDEDDVGQDSPLPVESDQPDQDGDPFGQFTPAPGNPNPQPDQPDAPDSDDEVAGGDDGPDDPAEPADPDQDEGSPADPEQAQPPEPGGDAQPQEPGGDAQPQEPGGDAQPQEPGGDAQPQEPGGEQDPGQTPDQGSPAPGPQPPSDLQEPEDGQVELARLFDLRQLPTEAEEADTTVTQTTSDDTEPTIEQATRLTHPDGDITVTGLRGADAQGRHDDLVEGDVDAREVSVRGQPAFLLEGQRLVWLVDGDPATFLSIDAPATVGTDEVLTIANGLELTP